MLSFDNPIWKWTPKATNDQQLLIQIFLICSMGTNLFCIPDLPQIFFFNCKFLFLMVSKCPDMINASRMQRDKVVSYHQKIITRNGTFAQKY